jgi:hypothetical protein
MIKSRLFSVLCACIMAFATTAAKSSLLGDEVNICLNKVGSCTIPITYGGEFWRQPSATVTDPGIEFFLDRTHITVSADFTADTLTLTITNIGVAIGLFSSEAWAFDSLNWSGPSGHITDFVELPGGNLPVTSTSFGDDYVAIEHQTLYFSNPGEVFTTTFKISGVDFAPTIDIKPDKKADNEINLKKDKNLKVAILGDNTFDALQVNPETVRFGTTGAEATPIRSRGSDFNRDGYADLILTFKTTDTDINCEDTEGVLTGETYSNPALTIKGSDAFTVLCQ